MKRFYLFILLVIFDFTISRAQADYEIEKLKTELTLGKKDTTRVRLMAELSLKYRNFTNLDSAEHYGLLAVNLAKRIKFYPGEAAALRELGFIYRVSGDIPKALDCEYKALHIAEENDYPFETAWCLNALGVIYDIEMDDHEKALAYFHKAIQYKNVALQKNNQFIVNSALEWNILTNMAVAFKKNGQLDSSFFYFNKVLNRPGPTGLIFLNLGEIEFAYGHKKPAIEYFKKALDHANEDRIDRTSCLIYYGIANYYTNAGEPDSAIYFAKQALEISQQLNYKRVILNAGKLLAGAYQSQDIIQSLYYRKIADSVNVELYGVKRLQSLLKIISDDQEHQYIIQKEKSAAQNRINLYLLLGALFITSFIGFIFYRNNQKEKKAKQILQEKNEVIEQTLVNLKSTQAQLIQSEKMASLGELTAGIAHEIQNPLNFVNNFSDVNTELVDELKAELETGNTQLAIEIADNIKDNEQKINHHGKRADTIVKGMLQHSRSSSGVKEPTDINALCDEYLRLSYHGLRAKDKSFNATMKTDFDVSIGNINIIPQDIGRVVLNLINNAFYVVDEKKKGNQNGYEPTVSVSTKKNNGKVEIRVADNGNGIPQKIVDKIFQPFFTTKPTGQGTGLGLSLSYDIVKAHGGEIKVETKEDEGTTFSIILNNNT